MYCCNSNLFANLRNNNIDSIIMFFFIFFDVENEIDQERLQFVAHGIFARKRNKLKLINTSSGTDVSRICI